MTDTHLDKEVERLRNGQDDLRNQIAGLNTSLAVVTQITKTFSDTMTSLQKSHEQNQAQINANTQITARVVDKLDAVDKQIESQSQAVSKLVLGQERMMMKVSLVIGGVILIANALGPLLIQFFTKGGL